MVYESGQLINENTKVYMRYIQVDAETVYIIYSIMKNYMYSMQDEKLQRISQYQRLHNGQVRDSLLRFKIPSKR